MKKRKFAIGDIHGCHNTLRTLLEDELQIRKKDKVYFLGDYINRGGNSSGVLNYLMDKIGAGYNFFPIRGNHEQNFLGAYNNGPDFFQKYLTKFNSHDLGGDNVFDYLNFCRRLPYYIQTKRYYFAHAGLNFRAFNPLDDKFSMLNQAFVPKATAFLTRRRLVHGHKVVTQSQILQTIHNKALVINIDNGCVYKNRMGLGSLCALDLNSLEVIFQKNIG